MKIEKEVGFEPLLKVDELKSLKKGDWITLRTDFMAKDWKTPMSLKDKHESSYIFSGHSGMFLMNESVAEKEIEKFQVSKLDNEDKRYDMDEKAYFLSNRVGFHTMINFSEDDRTKGEQFNEN